MRWLKITAGEVSLRVALHDTPTADALYRAAAQRFWDSPEYAEAIKLREGIGNFQVMLIDSAPIGSPA